MSELSLDNALRKIEYIFCVTGMNFESSNKTRSENIKYKIVYWFNFVWLNTDVMAAVAWLVASVLGGATFSTLIYTAPCLAFCLLTNVKSISMLTSDEYVNEIISILRYLEIAHIRQKKNVEKEKIIKNELKYLFIALKAMSFFNWMLLISFPGMPLCLMAFEYRNTQQVELKLAYFILYPFDAYDIKYWPWVYLKQTWAIVLVVFVGAGVDYLFYVCAAFVCIQFKLLQHDMRNFIPDNIEKLRNPDVELRDRLVTLVKWHQALIRAVQMLEAMYAKQSLANFTLSSLLICLCGFNMLMIDDKPFVVSFASFLFVCLLQIFAICYFGDKLMRSSTEVSDGIFESKWYLTNSRVGKDVTIIQLRSQKPCKISACGFADVNLKAFTTILSTSWSYFALLRSVYTSMRA